MNQATFTAANVRLRAAGASSDVAAGLASTSSTVILTPNTLLTAGTAYTMTVAGAVTMPLATRSAPMVSWPFTTTASPLTIFGDVTTADFSAGTPDSKHQRRTSLATAMSSSGHRREGLLGTALPAGWSSVAWNSGGRRPSAAVCLPSMAPDLWQHALSCGPLVGIRGDVRTTAATQHVGLGVDFNNAPWAIFSTAGGGALQARTTQGTNTTNTPISGSWLGAAQVPDDWNTTSGRLLHRRDAGRVAHDRNRGVDAADRE